MVSKHAEEAMEEQEIDLTPLIDCFLMLIIFFSCMEFKSLESKLPAYLPKDVGAGKQYVAPQEKLNIKVICEEYGKELPRYPGRDYAPGEYKNLRLEGHKIRWEVGAKKFGEDRIEEMLKELERLIKDKSKWVKDEKTNKDKPMTVVIEPQKDTTYGDVARTVDVVLKAGYEEVNFGGGMGARQKQ